MKEIGFILEKTRRKRYPAEAITDTDYADDLLLLENAAIKDEYLSQSLQEAARGIGCYCLVWFGFIAYQPLEARSIFHTYKHFYFK